jgi:hypothetical protein
MGAPPPSGTIDGGLASPSEWCGGRGARDTTAMCGYSAAKQGPVSRSNASLTSLAAARSAPSPTARTLAVPSYQKKGPLARAMRANGPAMRADTAGRHRFEYRRRCRRHADRARRRQCKSNALAAGCWVHPVGTTLSTGLEIPGSILTVTPRKQWTHARHPSLSGDVSAIGIGASGLALVPPGVASASFRTGQHSRRITSNAGVAIGSLKGPC